MPRREILPALLFVLLALLGGCSSDPRPAGEDAGFLLSDGRELLGNDDIRAISYSGHRKIPRSVENTPTLEETKEDLRILAAMDIRLLRTYNTTIFPHSERVLQAIRELKQEDQDFEMHVMLGAWVQCVGAYTEDVDHTVEDAEFNQREIEGAIRLAKEHGTVFSMDTQSDETLWVGSFGGVSRMNM